MVSSRAVNQLERLSQLIDKGYRVCYILISLNPKVNQILLNLQMEEYCSHFLKCIEKGMVSQAFSVRLKDNRPEIYNKIEFLIGD